MGQEARRQPGVAATRASDGSGDFEFSDTAEPGVYTRPALRPADQVGLFAVNLDSYESDLVYLADGPADETAAQRQTAVVAELKARLGQPPLVSYVDDPSTLVRGAGQEPAAGSSCGTSCWWWCCSSALFEPWLANQISGRLYARNRQGTRRARSAAGRADRKPAPPVAEGVRG